MASTQVEQSPLVAIVGPTASGKTNLAVKMAQQFNGEIICADSRTIYKGMDVGTAKPTLGEQAMVPHWGIDLVEPGEYFSAAEFKKYAQEKISEILSRGHLPFLVGGTGLYVDSVLFNFQFGDKADGHERSFLEAMSVEELQIYCEKHNIKQPENSRNKRYLVRAIERKSTSVISKDEIVENTVVVGITTEKSILRSRIATRGEQLFASNVVEEAITLGKKYGWKNEAMTGNIYRLIRKHLDGQMDIQELMRLVELSDWHLAKRQMTWLRRNPYILWGDLQSTEHYLSTRLARK